MRSLIPILLLLAPSLFALTSANSKRPPLPSPPLLFHSQFQLPPTEPNGPRHDAEIYKYRGHALAEIWVGRGAINAGDVHGQDLYYQMNTKLRDFCKIERSVGEMHSCDWNGLWVSVALGVQQRKRWSVRKGEWRVNGTDVTITGAHSYTRSQDATPLPLADEFRRR